MRRWSAALLAAAALVSLAAASAASASTLRVQNNDLDYLAVAAEDNTVTITREGDNYRVIDTTATITPQAPECVASAPGFLCNAATVIRLDIDLGNLDDSLTIGSSVTGAVFSDVDGDEGGDTLNGGAAIENSIDGDDSNDPDAIDTVTGGDLGDDLNGGPGNDTLNGGAGDDFFDDDGGDDAVNGGAGHDDLIAELFPDGADTFTGGPGIDEIDFRARIGGVQVSLDDVANDGAAGEGDNIRADVESIEGTDAGDELTGNGQPNRIDGAGGADVIAGGAGDEFSLSGGAGDDQIDAGPGDDQQIFGGDGADTVNGGAGDDDFESAFDADDPDTIIGGPGADSMDYTFANAAVVVTLDNVANDGVAGEGDNVRRDVEDVVGSAYSDRLVGSAAANELIGGSGRDALIGDAGHDGLDGGSGADRLNGGAGIDSLTGGSGADTIAARDRRRDAFSCGAGNDLVTADLARLDRTGADCERVRRPRRR